MADAIPAATAETKAPEAKPQKGSKPQPVEQAVVKKGHKLDSHDAHRMDH
jgi:hypothetical protein